MFSTVYKFKYFFTPFSHGEDGLTVHFNVHLDPSKGLVTPEDLINVISGQIHAANKANSDKIGDDNNGNNYYDADAPQDLTKGNIVEKADDEGSNQNNIQSVLGDLIIDEESLDIQGNIETTVN